MYAPVKTCCYTDYNGNPCNATQLVYTVNPQTGMPVLHTNRYFCQTHNAQARDLYKAYKKANKKYETSYLGRTINPSMLQFYTAWDIVDGRGNLSKAVKGREDYASMYCNGVMDQGHEQIHESLGRDIALLDDAYTNGYNLTSKYVQSGMTVKLARAIYQWVQKPKPMAFYCRNDTVKKTLLRKAASLKTIYIRRKKRLDAKYSPELLW